MTPEKGYMVDPEWVEAALCANESRIADHSLGARALTGNERDAIVTSVEVVAPLIRAQVEKGHRERVVAIFTREIADAEDDIQTSMFIYWLERLRDEVLDDFIEHREEER